MLTWLTTKIDELDTQISAVVEGNGYAQLLLTHPGVGALTALTTVLVLGPIERFPDSKHVVSYVRLATAINASADKQRLGKITTQGNALLRWVLGQAAPLVARADDDLRRRYFSVLHRRGRPKARVALARKLLVRLYVMLRDHIDDHEFRRRGSGVRTAQKSTASSEPRRPCAYNWLRGLDLPNATRRRRPTGWTSANAKHVFDSGRDRTHRIQVHDFIER